MEIGSRLKNARSEHGLTQEQVAEELGVSRQSISNWENNRAYPDIVSVIKLSDLYSVSLDELLKEDKNMIRHLAESTDAAASNKRLVKRMLIGVYAALLVLAELFYWLLAAPNGYSGDVIDLHAWLGWDVPRLGVEELLFCVFLSLCTGVLFVIAGKNDYFGKLKWLCVPANGILFMLTHFLSSGIDLYFRWQTYIKDSFPEYYREFNLELLFGNYFDPAHTELFWLKVLVAGMISAAAGLFIGSFIRYYHVNKTIQMNDKAFRQKNLPM